MTNNIKEIRLAFLLTPTEFAERLGVDVDQVRRLEATEEAPSQTWAEAVSRAFGVPLSAITDPNTDFIETAANANDVLHDGECVCRIGARFAILAIVAKIGGLKVALDLDEDDLQTAIQDIIDYTDAEGDETDPEERLIRLSQSLQIAALTILQSRGVDPSPEFPQTMAIAQAGALSLIQSFSRIDQMRRDQETR